MTLRRAHFLFSAFHDVPGRLLDVGHGEHFVFGARIFRPSFAGLEIHRADLPAFRGVFHAVLKAVLLLFVAHREPILHQHDACTDQHALELRAAVQELRVFGFGAKSHYMLYTGAVINQLRSNRTNSPAAGKCAT